MNDNIDEINLKDFINIAILNRKIIFLFFILVILIGLIFNNFKGESWEGQLKIRGQNNVEFYEYSKLFNVLNQMNLLVDKQSLEINADYLYDITLSELEDNEEIYSFLESNLSSNSNPKQLLGDIKLIVDDPLINEMYFSFTHTDKSLVESLLKSVIKNVNENTRLFLINKIKNSIDLYNIYMSNQLRLIEMKEISMHELNKLRNEFHIAFLIEKAQIARELNIQQNTYIDKELPKTASIYASSNDKIFDDQYYKIFNDQYYKYGYETIEKEIEILRNRPESSILNNSMNEMYSLQYERNILKNDFYIDFIKFQQTESDIYKKEGSFKSSVYDIDQIEITDKSISLIKIFIASFFSWIVFSFLFLIQKIYIKN